MANKNKNNTTTNTSNTDAAGTSNTAFNDTTSTGTAGSSNTGAAVGRSRTQNDTTDKLSQAVTGDKEAAKEVYGEAKSKAGEAVGRAYEKVSEEASNKISEQKSHIAKDLSTVADTLKKVDENIEGKSEDTRIASLTGQYSRSLAGTVERVSDYLDRKDPSEMLSDAEDLARRNPAVFIGGAFAVGFLLARFLKSSGSNRSYGTDNRTGSDKYDSRFEAQQGVTGIDTSGL